ncbi:hypothetical protein SAMN04488002_3430 [Litoreibacter janthinus]|uniref:Uncharacterized protein n=1 Tax=Litoreibacter janthinus TaxID=670154 RepID=A0A1I6HTV0_9RHOB|nr:hypothetical protein SAMN04488002_3430 [Litoreibacter janthinus]
MMQGEINGRSGLFCTCLAQGRKLLTTFETAVRSRVCWAVFKQGAYLGALQSKW